MTAGGIDASELEATWPLTDVRVGDVLPSYPTRTVVKVDSDQGEFVAKVDAGAREESASAVLTYLHDRGFPHAPSVLLTRSGRGAAVTSGGLTCLLEYLPRAVDDGVSALETWAELGQAMARLNAHTGFPGPFTVPLDQAMREIAEQVAGQHHETQVLDLLHRVGGLANVPGSSLIHGEVNFANARRRADGTVVLVDWDQAGRGPAALDSGYPLIIAFLDEATLAFDDGRAAAFYGSYIAGGGSVDRRQLFDAALFHALRYMRWGDSERRWSRILHALAHEDELCEVAHRTRI